MEKKATYQLFDYEILTNKITVYKEDYLVKALYKYVFDKWDFRIENIDNDSFTKAVGLAKSKLEAIYSDKDIAFLQFHSDVINTDVIYQKYWLFAYLLCKCNNGTPVHIMDFWEEKPELLRHIKRAKNVDNFVEETFPSLVAVHDSAKRNIEITQNNNKKYSDRIKYYQDNFDDFFYKIKSKQKDICTEYDKWISDLLNERLSYAVELETLKSQNAELIVINKKLDSDLDLANSEDNIERLKRVGQQSLILEILKCAANNSDKQFRQTIQNLLLKITRNKEYITEEINSAIDSLDKDYHDEWRRDLLNSINNIQPNTTNNFYEKVDKVENH